MTILIQNASILTLDSSDRLIEGGDVLIEGNRISAIGAGLADDPRVGPGRVIDGSGLLAMPGLINGHFHSVSAFMKGRLRRGPAGDLPTA